MSEERAPGFDTLSIHGGYEPDPTTGSRQVPIYQTTSFVFDSPEHAASLFALKEFGNIYTRIGNPTVNVLQGRMAALDGGVGAVAASSGHAAQLMALFNFMEPGAHLVAAKQLYGGSINQFTVSFPRAFGWNSTLVDATDPQKVKDAIKPETRAVFIESLANPGGVVTDIAAIAEVAHDAGLPLLVDNTMATPYLCRPLDHGADIVLYSTTKFLSGNGTSIGGIMVDGGKFDWSKSDKFKALTDPEPGYHGMKFHETFENMAYTVYGIAVGLRDLGTSQQPFNAFLTLLGLETLSLRMRRHCDNALQVARYLEKHDKVSWVSYAGLESSPYHGLAQKYLPRGAGSVFTFGVKGGFDAGTEVVRKAKLFSHLANIGDSRSLIIHPASTTHSQLDPQARVGAGAGDDVVRLSVGLEDSEDLLADLEQALA